MKKDNYTGFENYGTKHLKNLKKWVKKKAKQGISVYIGGGEDFCEIWADEIELYGSDVKNYFNYQGIKAELKKRKEQNK